MVEWPLVSEGVRLHFKIYLLELVGCDRFSPRSGFVQPYAQAGRRKSAAPLSSTLATPSGSKVNGVVKWYDDLAGYGVILARDQTEYLVHWHDINMKGFKTLMVGLGVTFEPESFGGEIAYARNVIYTGARVIMKDSYNKAASRSLRVFLCHASSDKARVRELRNEITAPDIEPWLDEDKLLPGHDWRLEINRAIREADVVLVCLSHNATNKQGFVQKEIRIALDVADEQPEGAIYLIPVRLEECVTPERLSRWQWVDMFQPQGLDRLLTALRNRADKLGIRVSSER